MRLTAWIPSVAGLAVLAACGSGGGDTSTPQEPTPPPATNTPPKAAFESACAALTCTFTDKSTDAEGPIASWQWSFGDDSTSTQQSPAHTYAAAQTYNVKLVVKDTAGLADSVTQAVSPTAPSADLTCTNAATPGTDATCTFTLPQAATVKAVIAPHDSCQAIGDVFAFTAPVADTLTANGCAAPVGTEADLAASPAGTAVSIAIRSGLSQYTTGVQVTGQYPQWTLNVEDAVGAPFAANYRDLIVTLTVTPSGP